MSTSDLSASSVYKHPRYYAIGYQWNTKAECDFVEACLQEHLCVRRNDAPGKSKPAPEIPGREGQPVRLLDIGCGAGRHLVELGKRGYQVAGLDQRPEMVEFAKEQLKKAGLHGNVSVGDLRQLALTGTYEMAACLMDTFRFLLTNHDILEHLQQVAARLSPGGLYVTDFWIPMKWDQIANEIYQWEQTEDGTTVRVFYVQYPETVDPVSQTFEDELVFAVTEDGGAEREIRGGRTRTRLIMPQEFQALVMASGVFETVGQFAQFDADKPLETGAETWRMVSVLRKVSRR